MTSWQAQGPDPRDQPSRSPLSGEERPFPLDLVPRVVQVDEWVRSERGVARRALALEAFLADVYGAQAVLADGIVPRRVVTSSSAHVTAAYGVVPANGVRVQVSGVALIRDEQGELRVLEDNLRTPSGPPADDQLVDPETDRPALLASTAGSGHHLDLGNASFADQEQQQQQGSSAC